MNETKEGFACTIASGRLETVRGQAIPPGTVAALGLEGVCAESRAITLRAVQMAAGLFASAEKTHRKDPCAGAEF